MRVQWAHGHPDLFLLHHSGMLRLVCRKAGSVNIDEVFSKEAQAEFARVRAQSLHFSSIASDRIWQAKMDAINRQTAAILFRQSRIEGSIAIAAATVCALFAR